MESCHLCYRLCPKLFENGKMERKEKQVARCFAGSDTGGAVCGQRCEAEQGGAGAGRQR